MSDLAALFERAMECPPDAREEFIHAECGGDSELENRLRRLIETHAAADQATFWSGSAAEVEARAAGRLRAERGGQLFGRYRIERLIGEGGMGEVYLAYDPELQRNVALKSIRGYLKMEHLLDRFGRERQILAQLNHENIARLLDVGTAENGRPFLVMEFIDGERIDAFVKKRGLGIPEILQLVLKVASAVSCAHRNLIVHRDLKPANILVTSDAEPKLLDFGIAKLLDSTDATHTAAIAMTPEYASPEQMAGSSITTASDVYSLGVLLHELLSGERLYARAGSLAELARAIATESPDPLRNVPADVDKIIQMALRKEPDRRYGSVDEFASDIRRYLEGYPVIARPATRGYRIRKFAGRNKAALGAVAGVLIAIFGGIAATTRQARIAERNFAQTRRLANFLMTEVDDAIKDLPGSTRARRAIVKLALDYLDGLSSQRGNDSDLRRELANAYSRVGDVQGAPKVPSLGDYPGALASYNKAMAILEPLAARASDGADARLALARVYNRVVAVAVRTSDLPSAGRILRKEIAVSEKLFAVRPDDAAVGEELATAYTALADISGNSDVTNLGNPQEALNLLQKAITIRERFAGKDSSNRTNRLGFAALYGRIGSIKRSLRDREGAVEAFRKAISMDEDLLREDPLSVTTRREIAVYSRTLALVLDQMGKLDQARQSGDRSHDLFSQIARQDPENSEAQTELADSYVSQGKILADLGKLKEARQFCAIAIESYQTLMASHPGRLPFGLRQSYQVSADIALRLGNAKQGIEFAEKELGFADRLLAMNTGSPSARQYRGLAFRDLGRSHELWARKAPCSIAVAQWREARRWYQRSVDEWTDLKRKMMLLPTYASELDGASEAAKRCDQELQKCGADKNEHLSVANGGTQASR